MGPKRNDQQQPGHASLPASRGASRSPQLEDAAFLRSVFDNIDQAVYVVEVTRDGEFHFSGVNPAFERLTGTLAASVAGHTPEEMKQAMGSQINEVMVGHFRRCLQTGRPLEIEEDFNYRGVQDWWWIHLTPLAEPDGRIFRIIGTIAIITRHKRTEQALRESEERYRTLVENQGEGIVIVDPEEKIIFTNRAADQILGVPPGLATGRQLIDFLDEDQHRILLGETARRRLGETSTYELVINRFDGQKRTLLATAAPRLDDKGTFIGSFGILVDITERKEMEEALRQSEQKLRSLIERSGDGIVLTDEKGVVLEWNPAQETITGMKAAEAIGKPIWDVQYDLTVEERHTPENFARQKAMIQEIYRKGGGGAIDNLIENDIQVRGGPRRTIQIQTYFIKTGRGFMSGAITRDITARKQTEDQLRFLSTHDHLTGLFNRAFFEAELARLENGRVFPVSIIMADLDALKQVNDTQGHAAGDRMLQAAAQLFKAAFRGEDVVARIGGDEFAVLLPGVGTSGVNQALERLRSSQAAYNARHPEKPVNVSVGSATGEKGAVLTEVLKKADVEMYQHKEGGRR